MQGIGIIVIIAIVMALHLFRIASHKGSIENKIDELCGVYVSHERCFLLSGIGPFHVVGKGRMIYKFTYEINGCVNEGWVRFGSLMGPNWQLDYQDDY